MSLSGGGILILSSHHLIQNTVAPPKVHSAHGTVSLQRTGLGSRGGSILIITMKIELNALVGASHSLLKPLNMSLGPQRIGTTGVILIKIAIYIYFLFSYLYSTTNHFVRGGPESHLVRF